MEQNIGEEDDQKMKCVSSSLKPRTGGLRTMPFIIVNECFEKVASLGILPNMIFYLKKDYHMQTATATSVLFVWSAISGSMAIFGAFLSDSCLGRFRVIVIGSVSSLLGMTLLWLTAMIPELKPSSCESSDICNSATAAQLAVLFVSFGLISIGAGCVRPCSIAFGADQLEIKENSSNDERHLDNYFNWYYASSGLSGVLAFSIVVYIQENLGWKVGFGVPAMLMFLSVLSFMVGSPYYIKLKARQSSLADFVKVAVVAFKNRKLGLSHCNFDQYYHSHDAELLAPTDCLRFLNKACIIRDERDLNLDGSASNSWTLCTVEQVESLKSVIRVIPMWSTGIVMLISLNQISFSTLQVETMDRRIFGNLKIPAGSLTVFMIVTLTTWIAFYDRILVPLMSKFTGRPKGFSCRVRIGIGLLLACAAQGTSIIIETFRRRMAIREGFEDQPEGIVDMSALWLVPQLFFLGLAEAFNSIGQIEFFYSYFSKSMSSFAMALYSLELAVANMVASVLVNIVDEVTSEGGKESWLSSNINKGHLNYYYGLLTFLGLLNYIYFLACCWAYGPTGEKPGISRITEDQQFHYSELPAS